MSLFKTIKEFIKIKEGKKVTFKELKNQWLEEKKITVKESTYLRYVYNIEQYLMPIFEKLTLKEIENYNFNMFIMKYMKELSPKTIKDIIGVLKQLLYYANDEYNCKFKIRKIKVPKTSTKKITVFTKRERTKIEEYCFKEDTLKSIGIIICLNTGIRIGELCYLRWKDIDFVNRTLNITKTVQRIYDKEKKNTKIIMDSPKTIHSVREIPLSNKLYDLLKKKSKKLKKDDYILTGSRYNIMEPRTYQSYFKKMLKKCKVKDYKFHTLRHTFATNCIEVGMDVKSLSEILGHASVEVTLNRYVHSNDKIKKKYLNKL